MSWAFALVLAMIIDAILGEPRWLWSRLTHPAILMGRAVGVFDQQLNAPPARRVKGVLAIVVLAVGAVLVGAAITKLGPIAEILCAAVLLAQRSLVQHVQAVANALRLSTGDGRTAVAMIVSRDCRAMTEAQIARSAIESASENLSDGIVAPAFWFLLAGPAGILFYKAINTADSMIGYRTPQYEKFGWAAARCDDLLNLIPARLTGALIALLGGRLNVWNAIRRDAAQHRSPNAGWPEAAMAQVLGVALAGPRSYDGKMQPLAWVNGEARREIGPDEIDAAIGVLWRVWALLLALVAMYGVLTAI